MGLSGMFSRTWDYRGLPTGPVLTPLGHIFDSKIAFFSQNMDKNRFFNKMDDTADFHESI